MPDYETLEDNQLLTLIVGADHDALECFYSRYSTAVFSLARYMIKDEAIAETTAQGSLMFNSGTGRGVFIASGLQPSSVGEEYQIWLGKKGQTPSNLGRLVTDEMGWGIAPVWSSESMEHYD